MSILSSLSRLRPRSGYDVVAVLSMCVALGTGGAYAAELITGAEIADESITEADIQNGSLASAIKDFSVGHMKLEGSSVWGGNVLDGSLSTSDIGNDNLTGEDVKDGALMGADIDEATLGKVPSAQTADKAPVKGAHYVHVTATNNVSLGSGRGWETSATAECDAGEVAVGGGYWQQYWGYAKKFPPLRAASSYNVPVNASDRGSYFVRAEVDANSSTDAMLHVVAVCVDAGF